MTSRERMRAVINHRNADKIAVDFGGMHSSGMSGMLYNDLKKNLGISGGDIKIYDVNQQLVIPDQWYLDKFQVDTMDIARDFAFNDKEWIDWNLPDGTPVKFPGWLKLEKASDGWVVLHESGEVMAKMVDGAFYFDQELYPFYGNEPDNFDGLDEAAGKVSWMSFTDPMWKNFSDPDFYKKVNETAKRLYERTDYCLIANYSSIAFEPGQWLYRNDEFFMKLLTEPAKVTALFEKLFERHMNRLEPYLKAVDGFVDVMIFSDDLGMQSAPMISPDMYRELIFPWHKKIFDYVHENSGIKTFLHSCGSIFHIIPHLIEAGLDILNPVQTQCTDMEADRLKAEYGKDLVFWGGGIDTQNALAFSKPDEIREMVRENCEIFMKDGGFVFTPIHNMLPGIPPENIIAMYDEVNSIKY